ncbi:Inositol-tetrakisphosphate 1-kinase [Nymphon striatum]|nr:Inositol-tetrakisphosphate 1-kinase [Nymphon striatum]
MNSSESLGVWRANATDHPSPRDNAIINTNFGSVELQENYKVALWISEKKVKRMNCKEISRCFCNNGMELILADVNKPISKQGSFCVIIHKIIEHLIKSERNCLASKAIIDDFEDYIKKHPELIVIDPLTSLRKITDRSDQYRLIEQSALAKQGGTVCIPTFVCFTEKNPDVNIKKLKSAKVKFPFVCKPLMADGTNMAHQMALVFNEDGLKDITPPCVAQTFINHNAVLFKIFVVGQQYYIVERPSLKNFTNTDQKTIFFATDEVSKSDSKSSLTKYGIDIIIEKDTKRHAIIDMNPFPIDWINNKNNNNKHHKQKISNHDIDR